MTADSASEMSIYHLVMNLPRGRMAGAFNTPLIKKRKSTRSSYAIQVNWLQ